MNKRILSIICLIVIVGLVGTGVFVYMNRDKKEPISNDTTQRTSQETSSKDAREAVYEHLPVKQQERVTDWKEATVSKVTLKANVVSTDGDKYKSYIGKEVYMVDFLVNTDAVPNNMIVYADVDTFEVIGYGLVD